MKENTIAAIMIPVSIALMVLFFFFVDMNCEADKKRQTAYRIHTAEHNTNYSSYPNCPFCSYIEKVRKEINGK